MSPPAVIVDEHFDLAGTDEKMRVRIYAPVFEAGTTWTCRVEIGPPIDHEFDVPGEGSLQALSLALRQVAAKLYSHQLWRAGKIGRWGEFGGFLGVPAPTTFLDFAPFPF